MSTNVILISLIDIQRRPAIVTRPILSYSEVIEIVELLRGSTHFSEFRLKSGDLEVEVRRGGSVRSPGEAGPAPAAPAVSAPPEAPAARPLPQTVATPPAQAQAAPAGQRYSERAVMLRSPMVGTFYRAPEPGAAPFVQVGQSVQAGTTLCIIEVMKLMNTIAAECEGVVVDILVPDSGAVEYGQVPILFA